MEGQGLGVFSTGTYSSVTSYNDVGERQLYPPWSSFFKDITRPLLSIVHLRNVGGHGFNLNLGQLYC
jgi:hypothetical protein